MNNQRCKDSRMKEVMPPELILDSRMLYFGWVPKDADAVRQLLPGGLRAKPTSQVFMNQYVVARDEQNSSVGAYSTTYLGVDVCGLDVNELVPARWWTHFWTSNTAMSKYSAACGAPVRPGGNTVLELQNGNLIATTFDQGREIIRTTATFGPEVEEYVRTHLRYITKLGEGLHQGMYPAIGRCARDLRVTSVEFLDPNHDVYALRPKNPLEVVWGFYFTKASFCYPGRADPLTQEELRLALMSGS